MPWPMSATPTSSPAVNGSSSPHLRTGGSGSIRGRISGPIPMPDPLDDKDFANRQVGSDTIKPPEISEKIEPEADDASHRSDSHHRSRSTPTARDSPAGASPLADSESSPQQSRPTTMSHQSPGRQTNLSSTLRYSAISEAPSSQPGTASDKPRRKSVFRGALSRLFGRKKRNRMSGMAETADTSNRETIESNSGTPDGANGVPQRNGHARSPTNQSAFFGSLRSQPKGAEAGTGANHERGPSTPEPSLTKTHNAVTGSRRSGLPRLNQGGPTGLSPRPASAHGRGSKRFSSPNADEEQEDIGRAVTNDFAGLKRRSRSMSGLPVMQDDEIEPRRRSAEILYWRQSYDPGFLSPLSSGPGDENSAAQMELPTAGVPPKTPPQPFMFGDIAQMNEMAGMKITQAVSMDTRIVSLEARVRRLEKVVTSLCHAVPNVRLDQHQDQPHEQSRGVSRRPSSSHHVARGDPTKTGHANSANPDPLSLFVFGGGRSRPSTQQSNISMASTADGHTVAHSSHKHLAPAFTSSGRPLSTATIRGVASFPTLSKDTAGAMTIDHYTTLIALIETERAARQALESEVRGLGHQINIIGRYSGYGRMTMGQGPPTGFSLGGTSAFDHDDEDEDDDNGGEVTQTKTHETDGVDTTGALDSGEVSPISASDQREEAKRRAARTMSLSEITYKSGHLKQNGGELVPQPI